MKILKINQSITDRKDASLALYFRDVSKLSMINQDEEVELAKRIQEGDKIAEEKLITANLRFVISVAKQYQGKGLDLIDLIQEGNLGLIQASKLYNPDKGIKFISYAVWWIRQSILRAISEQCRIIRVPMNQIATANKVSKFSEKYEQENGCPPSLEELEEKIDLDQKSIAASLASFYRSVSLDSKFNEDDPNSLIDTIPNETLDDTDSVVEKEDVVNEIEKILHKLPYRSSDVIRLVYGIGVQPMSHDEIANRFGIGGERISQIERNTLSYIKRKYKNELENLLQ